MTVTAEALRELHRLHRQLTDLRDRKIRGPKQIKAHQANVQRLEAALAQVQEDGKAVKMAVDDKQLQLRSKEDKLVELNNKLSSCSTNREYQALQEQISADKVATSVLEDEILEALSKVDDFAPRVAEAKENVAKGQQEFQRIVKSVEEKKQSIETDIERLGEDLKRAESELPPDFRRDYDRIIAAKGEDALAEVEGDICGGCFQQFTPNMLSDLTMGRAVFCKNCGRLIYQPETS